MHLHLLLELSFKQKPMTRPPDFKIRSFIRREGRITKAQQRALDNLLPLYTLPKTGQFDFRKILGNSNPTILEIGFGNGGTLLKSAILNPANNYIGIEIHRPGVGQLLNKIKANKLQNIRVINDDAISIIDKQIPPSSLDKICLFFPDPWHKNRHHKRRIVNFDFLHKAVKILQPEGKLHFATDWEDYALQVIRLAQNHPRFELINDDLFSRPETKFEKRGLKLGHKIWDIVLKKI